jgi:hypothetical protein
MDKLSDKIGAFTAVPVSFIKASQNMSSAAFRLFVILRFYTNRDSDDAFPSYKTLRQECNLSNGTLKRAIDELIEAGWLTRRKRFNGTAVYTLKYPSPLKIRELEPVLQKLENQFSKNQRLTRLTKLDKLSQAAQAFQVVFPVELTPEQQEVLESVDDMERWQAILDEWRINGWNPNVGSMLDRYKNGHKTKSAPRKRKSKTSRMSQVPDSTEEEREAKRAQAAKHIEARRARGFVPLQER